MLPSVVWIILGDIFGALSTLSRSVLKGLGRALSNVGVFITVKADGDVMSVFGDLDGVYSVCGARGALSVFGDFESVSGAGGALSVIGDLSY